MTTGNRMDVVIRQLTQQDASAYRTLMLDAYARFSDAFTSTAEERQAKPLDWWGERIANPDGTSVAFGAFAGGALIGTVGLEFETRAKTRHKSLLFGMFIEPGHQGMRLGKELVEAALDHARTRPGSIVVQLMLTDGNETAQRLYESCGFTTFGIEPMGLFSDGVFRSKVHMWRRVDRIETI